MRRSLIILVLIIPRLLLSQSRDKRSAPFTIRYNIGIPKSVSSQLFRTAFNGIVETNLSVNARIFSTFFVGLGYQYSHFQNNKQVFVFYQAKNPNGTATGASLSYNTRMIGNAGFLKIGYDKFFERGFVTYALNAGFMMVQYTNVINDSSAANRPFVAKTFNAPYLQPEISIGFMTDRALSFSVIFSYTTLLYNFDPKAPRFNDVDELRGKTNHYFMSWINIGFGVTVLLGKR